MYVLPKYLVYIYFVPNITLGHCTDLDRSIGTYGTPGNISWYYCYYYIRIVDPNN